MKHKKKKGKAGVDKLGKSERFYPTCDGHVSRRHEKQGHINIQGTLWQH